jgi:hypothetical protein
MHILIERDKINLLIKENYKNKFKKIREKYKNNLKHTFSLINQTIINKQIN